MEASTSRERFPITNPSNGVNPIDVSTDRPCAITPIPFDNSLEQGRSACQCARGLNHVHEAKFDRRASAVDDQDLHVNVEVSRHAPWCRQSSCQSDRSAAAFAPDFLPSKSLVYVPKAAALLHFAR